MFRPSRIISTRRLAICPHHRCLVFGFLLLASTAGPAHGQPSSENPGAHGLVLQLRSVITSEWTGHASVGLAPPEMYSTTTPFREGAAFGMGLDAAYVLGHGVAPFVAADFDLQEIHSRLGGFDDYGTVSVGIRIRRPLSRRIVPFAQAAVTRLRVASPVYTQPFLGGGMEFFLGRHAALSAALELPVAGSSSLDKRPRRFYLGTTWYLGRR